MMKNILKIFGKKSQTKELKILVILKELNTLNILVWFTRNFMNVDLICRYVCTWVSLIFFMYMYVGLVYIHVYVYFDLYVYAVYMYACVSSMDAHVSVPCMHICTCRYGVCLRESIIFQICYTIIKVCIEIAYKPIKITVCSFL